jgi:hypothetical protein
LSILVFSQYNLVWNQAQVYYTARPAPFVKPASIHSNQQAALIF